MLRSENRRVGGVGISGGWKVFMELGVYERDESCEQWSTHVRAFDVAQKVILHEIRCCGRET